MSCKFSKLLSIFQQKQSKINQRTRLEIILQKYSSSGDFKKGEKFSVFLCDVVPFAQIFRSVNAVGEDGERQSEELMKIYKMLLERQEKLAKDEYEVNNVLKKVTQMLNNLNNQSNESPQHDKQSGSSEVGQSQTKISENDQAMKISRNESIPEQLTGSTNEEIKTEPFYDEIANDYENATFEYEDITARTGLRSVNSQHIDKEINSMTGKLPRFINTTKIMTQRLLYILFG